MRYGHNPRCCSCGRAECVACSEVCELRALWHTAEGHYDIYGGNVERLWKIRAAIDPKDVMGLAGGWKF